MQMLDAHAWSTYINNGMSWDFIWDLVSYNIKEYGDILNDEMLILRGHMRIK